MNDLQQQLIKAGLATQAQAETIKHEKELEAEEAARSPLPLTIEINSKRILFGSIANIHLAYDQNDKISLLDQHEINHLGGIDFSMTYWLPVYSGSWRVQRVLSPQNKVQAYWLSHSSIDALKKLKFILKQAPKGTVNCTPDIRKKGIIVIDSYSWGSYDQQTHGYEDYHDLFSGPDCSFIDESAFPDMIKCLKGHNYIDDFAHFSGGCIMSFKDHEHMACRILLDESQQKVVGFLYFSGYSRFQKATLEGVSI